MSHKRKQEDNRRLSALHDETRGHWISGVYYDNRKQRLKRFSASDGRGHITKYFKRQANRKIRRRHFNEDDHALRGGQYRRASEYKWQIF